MRQATGTKPWCRYKKDGCRQRAVSYHGMDLCHACYQHIRFWQDRGVRDLLKRADQVALWGTRLGTVLNTRRVRRIA